MVDLDSLRRDVRAVMAEFVGPPCPCDWWGEWWVDRDRVYVVITFGRYKIMAPEGMGRHFDTTIQIPRMTLDLSADDLAARTSGMRAELRQRVVHNEIYERMDEHVRKYMPGHGEISER